MRTVAIVLLLAVVAAGGGGGEAPGLTPPGLAPLTLPVASNGTPDNGKYPDDRVIINVDAKGFIHWMGKKVTLDELGADLAQSWVIGDSAVDVGLAQRGGCRGGVLVLTGSGSASTDVPSEVPRASSFEEAVEIVLKADQGQPASGGTR